MLFKFNLTGPEFEAATIIFPGGLSWKSLKPDRLDWSLISDSHVVEALKLTTDAVDNFVFPKRVGDTYGIRAHRDTIDKCNLIVGVACIKAEMERRGLVAASQA